jgi:hypothetical protein
MQTAESDGDEWHPVQMADPREFPTERVAMINDDVVKCPLCGGFTHIEKPELLAALRNPRLREQIEQYVAELLKSPVDELSTVGATQQGRDFQKDVHNWNPCVPMWRRSPKE